jgi:hypothetical protein
LANSIIVVDMNAKTESNCFYIGGYSTAIEMTTDANGGAKTFGLLFEAGGIVGAEQMLAFMNFTV